MGFPSLSRFSASAVSLALEHAIGGMPTTRVVDSLFRSLNNNTINFVVAILFVLAEENRMLLACLLIIRNPVGANRSVNRHKLQSR